LNAEVGKTHRHCGFITFLAIFGNSLTPSAESPSFARREEEEEEEELIDDVVCT
jgi:hypothetical protein